jgi:hypothetical protein
MIAGAIKTATHMVPNPLAHGVLEGPIAQLQLAAFGRRVSLCAVVERVARLARSLEDGAADRLRERDDERIALRLELAVIDKRRAVEVLTRYFANELGSKGITVNTLAPGAVATDFFGGLLRDNEQVQKHISSETPLGRFAVPADIAGAISALLAGGNRFVTGQRIEVSGGIHS